MVLEGVSFKPEISLGGFRVVSSFDIEKFTCANLQSQVFQLAIVLYPTELFNEKFLLGVRNCLLKLPESHPVKRWIKSLAVVPKVSDKEQKKIDFLGEILTSQFNLITDPKVKTEVIHLISDVKGRTNLEKLLKAYLYLMIGNITRSDKMLKTILLQTPREAYKGYSPRPDVYERLTGEHLEKVLRKFSRHPADRLIFNLLNLYIKSYMNKVDLITLIDDMDTDVVKEKIDLSYTHRIAPDLVDAVRLMGMSDKRKIRNLRSDKYSLEMQSQWIWPFQEVDPLVSEAMVEQLKEVDAKDPLWAIYLLNDEKLADLYTSKGGVAVAKRRQYLRENLQRPEDFMLTLYKLIDLGDIDASLVERVSQFMIHE